MNGVGKVRKVSHNCLEFKLRLLIVLECSILKDKSCFKPDYEPRFFGKTQIIAFPRVGLSNSVRSLQVRSCAVKQSARDENSEDIHMQQGMNIVFVSADIAPCSKIDGLCNVLDDLLPTMTAKGHRVMVITPMYNQYGDALHTGVWTEINVGDMYETVCVLHCYTRGVDSRMFLGKYRRSSKCLFGAAEENV